MSEDSTNCATTLAGLTPTVELPSDARGYYCRGLALQEQRLYGLAIAAYTRAIVLDEDFVAAWRNKSFCLAAYNPFSKRLQAAAALNWQRAEELLLGEKCFSES